MKFCTLVADSTKNHKILSQQNYFFVFYLIQVKNLKLYMDVHILIDFGVVFISLAIFILVSFLSSEAVIMFTFALPNVWLQFSPDLKFSFEIQKHSRFETFLIVE